MKKKHVWISASILLFMVAIFIFTGQQTEKKIAVIDIDALRQEFFYRIATDDTKSDEKLQEEIQDFAEDFVEFQNQVQKIALERGYVVLRKDLVMGGAEDITPQAIKLLEEIRRN